MSSLAELEDQKRAFKDQLEIVTTELAADPNNAELKEIKREIEDTIQDMDELIAEAKAELAPPKKAAPAPGDGGDKWSRENHPALKAQAGDNTTSTDIAPETAFIQYNVNDSVMAKWMSGDKGFYPAHITSITGSSTDPVFTVRFKEYKDTVETLRLKDIRPIGGPVTAAAGTKRKAEVVEQVTPGSGLPVPPPSNNGGSSLPAPAPKPAGKDNEKPKNVHKKIKPNKELEASKNKWQEFNAKSKFKTGGLSGATKKKDSMFRTPEGVHGRVGFISSGKSKAKELTRTRNVYDPIDEDENRE